MVKGRDERGVGGGRKCQALRTSAVRGNKERGESQLDETVEERESGS